MTADVRHVLHVLSSFDPGGIETRLVEILSRWSGTRHTILARNGRTGCVSRLPSHVSFQLEPPPPIAAGTVSTVRAMMGVLRRQQPDLVLTYNFGTIETVLAARLLKLPRVVHHEDGFGPDEVVAFKRRRVWLRRVLLRTVRAVVVPSLRLKDIAVKNWRLPETKVHHLPNGVDLERFTPAPAQQAALEGGERSSDGFVVGTVGGLRPEKDHALLLRAVAQMAERARTRVVLVGDGPLRSQLERQVDDLGLRAKVQFAGAVADTSGWYRQWHAFVLSSSTEQMPLSVLEAMASGLPVVATGVGDVAHMVSAENRPWIVPAGDPAGLANALDQVCREPELRRSVGVRNRAVCARSYEQGVCLQRSIDLYEKVLARG